MQQEKTVKLEADTCRRGGDDVIAVGPIIEWGWYRGSAGAASRETSLAGDSRMASAFAEIATQ